MYKNCTVGVVIPAYNEEGFVGKVIATLPDIVDHVYVVDDCSTDGTWEEIQEAIEVKKADYEDVESEAPKIEAIRHERNRGVGAAIANGYRRALEDDMDVTAVMNGDGQMDPEILDRIIDPVVEGRADYAKGNRLFSRDHVEGMTAWRRFGNASLTTLTKIASGYWKTMDSQNGYTAISGQALEEIDLDSLYEGYGFCNDMLVRLNAREMRVADVEMEAIYGEEKSTIAYHQFIPSVSLLLFKRYLWRLKVRYLIRDFHPLVGLYLIGSVITSIGVAGILKGSLSALLGSDEMKGSLDFPTELTVLGLMSTIGAMILDMKENEKYEEQIRHESEREDAEAVEEPKDEQVPKIRSLNSVSENSSKTATTLEEHDTHATEPTNGETSVSSDLT